GVEGDLAAAGARGGLGLPRPVVHRGDDDGAAAGEERARVRALLGLAGHPGHAGFLVPGEPGGESGAIAVERGGVRDAYGVEAGLAGPPLQRFRESHRTCRAMPRTTLTSPVESCARPKIRRRRRIIPSTWPSLRKP